MRDGMVQYEDALEPLMVPIDSVIQHPDNYNEGDVEAIIESIHMNGMYRPIYVSRETKEIVAGNHTWQACAEMGAQRIPVIWLDNDRRAIGRMLADNRVAGLARPNETQLLVLLSELEAAEALSGTGYDAQDVEQLRALEKMKPDFDQDFAQWPTLCFQVPPHVKRAFYDMTDAGIGDRERLEILLRLAGWDGSA